jgi:RimJ/RimL family protein N-acetyltransferase
VELQDDGVLLREPIEDDLEAVADGCSDPDLARFIPDFPSPYRLADARRWFAHVQAGRRKGDRVALLICDGRTGAVLGGIEVRLGEVGSIGYWVRADSRGRGIATRALKLLSGWAVTHGGVERLELTTHPENVASQRVAAKAGFTREGVLRSAIKIGGARRDSVLYSLVPADVVSGG